MSNKEANRWYSVIVIGVILVAVFITWQHQKHEDKIRDEGYHEGYASGYEDGGADYNDAVQYGSELGYEEGYNDGYADGLDVGASVVNEFRQNADKYIAACGLTNPMTDEPITTWDEFSDYMEGYLASVSQ